MSATVQPTTANTFQQDVLGADTVVIVDFWAPWCGPCRMVRPELEKAAAALGATAKIYKVNVDEQPALASRYGVMSIPTLVFFADGQEIGRHIGFLPATTITAAIEDYRKTAA